MESLKTHIEKFNLPNQLVELNNCFDPSITRTKITFWGHRVVTVKGYSGDIFLNKLMGRILKISGENAEKCKSNVDEQMRYYERIQSDPKLLNAYKAGAEFAGKLRFYYKVTDYQIKKCNFFTRLLIWIRGFFDRGMPDSRLGAFSASSAQLSFSLPRIKVVDSLTQSQVEDQNKRWEELSKKVLMDEKDEDMKARALAYG